MKRFIVVILMVTAFLLPAFIIRADELDDITKQLATLNEDLKGKEANFQQLNDQLEGIKQRVAFLEQEIVKKEKEVKLGEQTLDYQKKLLNERAKSYYKNINKNAESFLTLLIASDLSTSLQNFFYQKTVVDQDRDAIIKVVLYIKNLENKKASLAREKAGLASLKDEIDRQSQILAGEISTTRSKVVELTARQQEIIASRIGSLNLSRSAGSAIECVDDRNLDPGFGSAFAFYTYGIPHRVGLNQWGAKGRADAGQNSDTILRAYFNFDTYQNAGSPNINVNDGNGYNTGNIIWSGSLEDYVKRIYEVPGGWPMEALKAQAIAARSYVLASTGNGSSSICANTNCQVFQTNPKGGAWEQAANDTSGQVMVSGGQTIKAWFSSTFGGFAHTSAEVWGGSTSWTKNFADASSGVGNFSDLQANSWDKESKCFYIAQGKRGEYSNSAWLKPSEVADIANTLLLVKSKPDTAKHLYQLDKPNPEGTDNWDENRVRQELSNPFTSVSSVSVSADFGGGYTNSVTVSGNKTEPFPASEWKDRFNLRAPSNISIVGPLFNIEKR